MSQENVSGGGGPIVTIVVGLAVIAVALLLIFSGKVEQSQIGIQSGQSESSTSQTADAPAAAESVAEQAVAETSPAVEQAAEQVAQAADAAVETITEAARPVAAGSEDYLPMPLALPNPVFAGTPSQVPEGVRVDRSRLGKKRPAFLAPRDAANLAEGKPVTSSDKYPIIGSLELVTDADKEALDGRYVELAPGKQHVTVDLGAEHTLYAVVFWHNHLDPRVYRDIIVMISNDPEFKEPTIVFNNDHDNSMEMGVGENFEYFESDEGELAANTARQDGNLVMAAPLGSARYVRLWSNGSTADDQNHYSEVEVWGKP